MADDFTTSSTLRGLEWDAAQVRLKERWSAKVHVECEGVSAKDSFIDPEEFEVGLREVMTRRTLIRY